MDYYITFGMDHPLRDYCVIARGNTYGRARAAVFQVLGDKWCSMLDKAPEVKYCALGVIGEPIDAEAILETDETFEVEQTPCNT